MKIYYKKLLEELERNQKKLIRTRLKTQGSIYDLQRTIVGTEDFKHKNYNECMQVLKSGKPELIRKENEMIFIEPFFPKERLIILGGGHIAVPLVKAASIVGFEIMIVDDRMSFANKSRFPSAHEIICDNYSHFMKNIKITSSDYIVIITRGHRYDIECLREIMGQQESQYVGMIGSRNRVKIVMEQLKEEGYDKDRLNRVCTPIGLPIGAVTPEEIGISIVSELIKRKRIDSIEKLFINRSNVDYDVLVKLAEMKEACSVVTILDTKGSVPRGSGAKMIIYPDGRIEGSIGGGCTEGAVIHQARSIIGKKEYFIQNIDMTGDTAEEEGMVCGGIMKVLIEDYGFDFD